MSLSVTHPSGASKVIARISPKVTAEHMPTRAPQALASGYTGARIDRAQLSRYLPTAGSATADTIRDLPMLRARSRDQMRNAPLAIGALNTKVSHVVGTGLSMTPSLDANFLGMSAEASDAWAADTKRRFEMWAISLDCDLSRNLNFYGIQSLAYRSTLESGDIFVVTPRVAREVGGEKLALQLIEADRVCNPNRAASNPLLVDGIELSETTGEATHVHISKNHPGDTFAQTNEWTRVALRGSTGRRNVLQLLQQLRPGQVRGVPMIAPILEPLRQLSAWTDNELNAAVVSSLFSVFVKMDPNAFDSLFEEDAQEDIIANCSRRDGVLESGQAINLLPGESIETSTPGRPNPEFDPFWSAIVRQIGMALDLPYEVLTMHFQSSYSAARAALLMAWKSFRSSRDWLATYLCQPVYELWLTDEIAEGRISAPGFFTSPPIRSAWCGALWTGDGPGSIDPAKEVDAAQKRVDLGISTKEAESILHDGVSWYPKHLQRVKEIEAERNDGIYYAPMNRAPAEPAPVPDDGSPAPGK
jgi:lambda family phage portal protein